MSASENNLFEVLQAFDVTGATVALFGSGLINHTWKVTTGEKNFILQRINSNVFRKPEDIGYNIRLMAEYLKKNFPEYYFIAPLQTLSGDDLYNWQEGWYRLAPFAEGSHSYEVVHDAAQAYEAARQFGKFSRLLSGLDASKLRITIPDFHNLQLRFDQFKHAVETGNKDRISQSAEIIQSLKANQAIVEKFQEIQHNPAFKIRIMHHDTKISNVLFDGNNKGLCVIDLDTVMPGYFISDVGDMMRTYLSPVSEEEKDIRKIFIRQEILQALIEGYRKEMEGELTSAEEEAFMYSGKFMIYMQALRFMTDHLQDDRYYGAKYEGHNLVRARNQLELLKRLMEVEKQIVK